MPAGRPRKPGGTGRDAPVLSLRLDAEHEAALRIIAMEAGQLAPTRRQAALLAIRYHALHVGGAERLERATAAVTRKRARAG